MVAETNPQSRPSETVRGEGAFDMIVSREILKATKALQLNRTNGTNATLNDTSQHGHSSAVVDGK